MGRIMALDVGEKTIGVALSDETHTFAFPNKTIRRQEGYRRDMGLLKDLVASQDVEEIVVGLPLTMSGERGIQAEKVEAFVDTLRRFTQVSIVFQDERLSTSEAERILIAGDTRREARKQVVDSVAASVILQTHLDRRRHTAGEA